MTFSLGRREFLGAGAASLVLAGCSSGGASPLRSLTQVDRSLLVTPAEAVEWHRLKVSMGPALSGNASWRNYMSHVEEEMRAAGCVDIVRNAWTYDLWETTEWPDDSAWSLDIAGSPVRVANYGANSGSTGPEGVTAPLVLFDPTKPDQDVSGKIVVFQPTVRELELEDYEFYSDGTDGRAPPPSAEFIYQNNIRMNQQGPQLRTLIENVLKPGKAAGCVFVMDVNYERLKGYYTFGVPEIHDCPSVIVDRVAGAAVVDAARQNARARIKLIATVTPTETWQLIGVLPGRHYGTPQDEMIQLTTHSDGPSISQDNGPYGLLAAVKYWSKIPQQDRPRSLFVFHDNRHYMPGAERAFAKYDWFELHPEARDPIKCVIGIEHLGQDEYYERGEAYERTGRPDETRIWVTNNQNVIDLTVQAVRDNKVPNAYVRNVDRPGVLGRSQGRWRGMAAYGRRAGLPSVGIMGDLDAYWSTAAGLERFNAELFCDQCAFVVQVIGAFMEADFTALQAPPLAE